MAAAGTTIEPGGGGEGERSSRRNREETRAKLRPIVPDLDLDAVDQEQRHKSQKHGKNSGKNQEEEGRHGRSLSRNRAPSWDEKGLENQGKEGKSSVSRSRTTTWDRNAAKEEVRKNQEEGLSSRSVSRNRATSWGTATAEEGAGLEVSEKKRRSKRKEADILRDSTKMMEDRESKRMISENFSFLMPRDDQAPSDSESAASYSEVSQSAASIAWREDSDWRRADSNSPPGRWIKPSHQKLSQVLIGSRLSGQSMAGGLSL